MLKNIKSEATNWMLAHQSKFSRESSQMRLTMCKKCYAFNYKNNWQFYRPQNLAENRGDTFFVKFTQCPMCIEEENSYSEATEMSFANA